MRPEHTPTSPRFARKQPTVGLVVAHSRYTPGAAAWPCAAPALPAWMIATPWTLRSAAIEPPRNAAVLGSDGEQVVIVASDNTVALVVRLRGAERAVIRLERDTLCVGDDCGRALVINLVTRELARDLRVR